MARWIHAELWLLPNGLLRVSSGLGATIAHARQRTAPEESVTREFSPGEVDHLQAEDEPLDPGGRNRLGRSVQRPSKRPTLAELNDGRRVKLLWLRADRASEPLRHALASWGISV
jgi:hypothetical protein